MKRFAAIAICSLLLTACSDEDGTGDVAVNTWGEEYIEQGIPAAEFEDGGSATYTKFLISFGTVTLDDAQDGPAGSIESNTVFDLVSPGPHDVGTIAGVSATTHDDFDYMVVPVSATTTVHASAAEADATMMASMGYAIYVEGTVSNGNETKSFRWGFSESTHYDGCVDVSSGQELAGVVVVDGGQSEAQLTIHGDHLFYDDLLSSEAKLRSQVIMAADADMDGEVTMAELEAVPLADISSEDGPYGVAASDVNDLGAYLRAATRTLGHFNGEGHCEVHGGG